MTELRLELDDGQSRFRPGEAIRGTVSWQLDEPVEALEVRLFWYTQGKGDRDIGGEQTVRIEHPGTQGSDEFEFSAPASPYSFSGTLISLIWALELVELPDGDAARQEIVLSPSGEEIRLTPVEPLDMSKVTEPS